jgi:L-rhamnose mutarotase
MGGEMKRYGMTIRIRHGSEDAYRAYHAAVWPEVLETIRTCNIKNYSIFWKDDRLFSYFEYTGVDFESDSAKMAAHAKTRDWWAIVGPMQEPLETRKSGEWWAEMEEVFHSD